MPAPTLTMLRPPGVIQELIQILQASPVSSDQTLIRWGLLPELPTLRERVYLLGVRDYLLAPTTRAHRVRDENFGIEGLIEVEHLGEDTLEAAGSRAWELLTGLDEALWQEQSLSDGTHYTGALSVSLDEIRPSADGWFSRIIFMLVMESKR